MNEINTELTEEQKEKIDNELVYYPRNPSFDEIIDNIYVGNYAFALNKKMLIDNKITHILNCGNGLMNFYEKENIFKYLYLPLYDSPNEKIEKHLKKYKDAQKNGTVLMGPVSSRRIKKVERIHLYVGFIEEEVGNLTKIIDNKMKKLLEVLDKKDK